MFDLFPSGRGMALRLDFFGDEIDSLRRFDPADQRSTEKAEAFILMPATEALLDDGNDQALPLRYRETFGATRRRTRSTRRGPRAAALAEWSMAAVVRGAAIETLFDHLGEHDIIVRDQLPTRRSGGGARRSRIITRTASARFSRSPGATDR